MKSLKECPLREYKFCNLKPGDLIKINSNALLFDETLNEIKNLKKGDVVIFLYWDNFVKDVETAFIKALHKDIVCQLFINKNDTIIQTINCM